MTVAQFRNLSIYAGIWIAIALAGALGLAIGNGAVPGFSDGQILAPARTEIASALALLVSGGGIWLAANRPRFGSEMLAATVSAYKALGYHRDDLAVMPKVDNPTAVALAAIATMSADDLGAVRDAALARHQALGATPAPPSEPSGYSRTVRHD